MRAYINPRLQQYHTLLLMVLLLSKCCTRYRTCLQGTLIKPCWLRQERRSCPKQQSLQTTRERSMSTGAICCKSSRGRERGVARDGGGGGGRNHLKCVREQRHSGGKRWERAKRHKLTTQPWHVYSKQKKGTQIQTNARTKSKSGIFFDTITRMQFPPSQTRFPCVHSGSRLNRHSSSQKYTCIQYLKNPYEKCSVCTIARFFHLIRAYR